MFGHYQFLTDYGFSSCLTIVDFIKYWSGHMGMPFGIFVFIIYYLFLVDKLALRVIYGQFFVQRSPIECAYVTDSDQVQVLPSAPTMSRQEYLRRRKKE